MSWPSFFGMSRKQLPAFAVGGLLLILAGCETTSPDDEEPSESDQVVEEVAAHEVFVVVETLQSVRLGSLPRPLYVYPPLMINDQGQPMEQLSYAETTSGAIDWVPPSALSVRWRTVLLGLFAKRGSQPVTFEAVTSMNNPHSILIVNAFYTPPLRRSGDHPEAPLEIRTRIVGFTIDDSLDPSSRRNHFDVTTRSYFSDEADAPVAVSANFQAAFQRIGIQGLATIKIPVRLLD